MKETDPRLGIAKSIDLAKLRVEIKRSPIIFLCGGQIESNHDREPASVRCKLLRHLMCTDSRLLSAMQMAEDVVDWGDRQIYKDLHVLERHFASISTLIILFLECPGALAELGMFCENRHISKKLMIFIENDHYNATSFIARGPIRLIDSFENTPNRVRPYQLGIDANRLGPSEANLMDFIYTDIRGEIDGLNMTAEFDPNEIGHLAFFIVSIVSLFSALTITEVQSLLKALFPSDTMALETLRQLLFFLEKTDLLKSGQSGKTVYFQKGKQDLKIDLFDSKTMVEHAFNIREFYKNDPEQKRRHSFMTRPKPISVVL